MRILLLLSALPEMDTSHEVQLPIMAPPLTLPVLAAVCRQAGHDPVMLDTRFCMSRNGEQWVLDREQLSEEIQAAKADIAAISTLSSSFADAKVAAAICRDLGMTVIGGGLHATVAPQDFKQCGHFDYIVQGEAEITLPKLLIDIATGQRPRRAPHMYTLTAERMRDLSDAPVVVDLDYYRPAISQYAEFRPAYVELSRGCFKRCTFCEVAVGGAAFRPIRPMPIERVLKWVDRAVADYDVNFLLVADSIATVFRDSFDALMAHAAEHHSGVTVQFNATVDRFDTAVAESCRDVPCSVWFGFESGSQRILDLLEKGTTVAQAIAAGDVCRQFNIPAAFNTLIGLPYETEADYAQTLEVFERCPSIYPNPNILNPLPGTPLYDYCRENDLLFDAHDHSIWTASRIERSGRGPVRSVDYEMMLRYRALLCDMQAERTLVRR